MVGVVQPLHTLQRVTTYRFSDRFTQVTLYGIPQAKQVPSTLVVNAKYDRRQRV